MGPINCKFSVVILKPIQLSSYPANVRNFCEHIMQISPVTQDHAVSTSANGIYTVRSEGHKLGQSVEVDFH